jgi:DNA-binding transcriptional regulator YiaG
MTPSPLRTARARLQPTPAELAARAPNQRWRPALSAAEFARRLDPVRPPHAHTVQHWESGRLAVPAWVLRRLREMLAAPTP